MTQLSGPSAGAPWAPRPADPASPDASGTVLTVPDAADAGLLYYLPDRLAVAEDAAGLPVLSLTVLLDGVPDAGEPSIDDRVTGGSLAFDATLRREAPVPGPGERELRPLFARDVFVELVGRDGEVLASGRGAGAAARVPLAVTLDRDGVLAALGALDGAESGISLRARVAYRAAGAEVAIRLTGRWADVHDAVAEVAEPGAAVGDEVLAGAYERLLADGVLTLSRPDPGAALLGTFLTMAKVAVLSGDGRLGRRPAEAFTIDLTRTAGGAESGSVDIGGDLAQTLGGVLDGRDRDAFVGLVSLRPPPGRPTLAVSRTPRRVASNERRTRMPVATAPLRFVMTNDDTLVSPGRLQATDRAADAHVLFATADTVVDAGLYKAGRLDDDMVEPPEAPPPSMPVVDDEAGWTFVDRAEPSTAWYVPSFELVVPSPTDTAATSPFTFSFARAGATAQGEPGLDATVTFRLREVRGAAAEAALAARGNPPAQALQTADTSVTLELPFRDETGVTQAQRFAARVERVGDVLVASVDLIDSWARLCYGALSVPGFQAQPARVEVAWSFGGCVALFPWQFELAAGAKVAMVNATFAHAVELTRAAVRAAPRAPANGQGDARSRLARERPDFESGATIIARPDLVTHAANWYRPTYTQRTFLRSQTLDMTMPCAEFGGCYVERRPEGDVAIGCQDALRLGQASWRQYEELTALADPAYRVYRSLQQPGRFLVVPAAYRVSRHPPSDAEHAYRPLILLYAALDAHHADNNRVVVDARLQADLPPATRARLLERLAVYAANPIVVLPTDVECEAQFAFGVPVTGLAAGATLQPDGIAVTFGSDLAGALLLRDLLTNTGIAGSVSFTFPDGSSVSSALVVSLRELTGPYAAGAVAIATADGEATLVNRIERSIDVSDLLVATGGAQLTAVPVEQTLAPGASARVAVPPGLTAAYAAYSAPPADPVTLEEVRAFVEDITTNVLFLDLIDHGVHGVQSLAVAARLADLPGEQQVAMEGAPAVGSATFVLPLTTYLSRRVVQYRATVVGMDGAVHTGDWIDWDLDSDGAVVSLTWDALAIPEPQETP